VTPEELMAEPDGAGDAAADAKEAVDTAATP